MHVTTPLFLALASLAIASDAPSSILTTSPSAATNPSSTSYATPCSSHSPPIKNNPSTTPRTISLGIAHRVTTLNPTLTLTSTIAPSHPSHGAHHHINGTGAWPTALYKNHSSHWNNTASNSSSAAKPSGNNSTVSTGQPSTVPKITSAGNMIASADVGFAMVGLALLGWAAVFVG